MGRAFRLSFVAIFLLMFTIPQSLGALESRHFIGLDTQAALSFRLGADDPLQLFDLTASVNRISSFVTYGPPNLYLRFRLGGALNPGAAFSLFTGLDLPLYEKLNTDGQRLFVAALFADADFPFAAPFRLGFDFGAYASLMFSLTGLSVGVRVDQDWLVLPFVSYSGAFFTGNFVSRGESE